MLDDLSLFNVCNYLLALTLIIGNIIVSIIKENSLLVNLVLLKMVVFCFLSPFVKQLNITVNLIAFSS